MTRSLMLDVNVNAGGTSSELLELEESYYLNNDNTWWHVHQPTAWLNDGVLTLDDLDLRMEFSKTASGDPWQLTASYRNTGGEWTVFTCSSTIAQRARMSFLTRSISR